MRRNVNVSRGHGNDIPWRWEYSQTWLAGCLYWTHAMDSAVHVLIDLQ